MASTKYPNQGCLIGFPWLTADDVAKLPQVLLPNWRVSQRPPPPSNASQEELLYFKRANYPMATRFFFVEYNFAKYLEANSDPAKTSCHVVLRQSYDGETLIINIGRLWSPKLGFGEPRIDMEVAIGTEKPKYGCIWSPLVLAIAPLRPDTPHQHDSLERESLNPEESIFLGLVQEFGIPKK